MHSILLANRIRCFDNHFWEFDNCFDGIIIAFPTFLSLTQSDGHIQHIDMGKLLNVTAPLLARNVHLICDIRWIKILELQIWQFSNAVSTSWNSRYNFTVTRHFIIKLLFVIRVRKTLGSVLARWTNNIGRFWNPLLMFLKFEVSKPLFEKVIHDQRRKICSKYIIQRRGPEHVG